MNRAARRQAKRWAAELAARGFCERNLRGEAVRNLRRLGGRVDPERFACTVDDVADGVASLAWTDAVHCSSTRAKTERPAAANGAATNERRLLALVRAQARDIDELRRVLAAARRCPRQRPAEMTGNSVSRWLATAVDDERARRRPTDPRC